MATSAGPAIQDECSICCDKFNNSTRDCIICEYGDCNYQACKTCVRQYLMGTTENPHCMNCKKVWPQNFVVMKLNRSFVTKDYKSHRRTLLLEREISKLPDTMEAANKAKMCLIEEEKIKKFNEEIKDLQALQNKIYTKIRLCNAKIYNIVHGINEDDEDGKGEVERRKFILKCPNEDCRGYVSTQYKCDLCELFTCKNCLEIIGYSKEDPHECNEDNVKSAEMIRKDTKPCPSCGARIFKLEGCDQMWCTECHKAFSWRTGHIDNGVVHNPHYYQYQQSINNGQAPRNPGDIVCGGLIGWYDLRHNIILRIPDGNSGIEELVLRGVIPKIHRMISHITYTNLRMAREKVRDFEDNEALRIAYILQNITKEELSAQLYKNDNVKRKFTELLHIYELLSVVGIEMFNEFNRSENKKLSQTDFINLLKTKLQEYRNLCDYCNKQLETISVSYNNIVIQINEKWEIVSKKFSLAKAKKNKLGEGNKSRSKQPTDNTIIDNTIIGNNNFTAHNDLTSAAEI